MHDFLIHGKVEQRTLLNFKIFWFLLTNKVAHPSHALQRLDIFETKSKV